MMKQLLATLLVFLLALPVHAASDDAASEDAMAEGSRTEDTTTKAPFIAVLEMDMMILPGTQEYLEYGIERASEEGAKLLVVKIDTPGGMLNTSQEMIKAVFQSPIPIVMYVSPTGGTATSAGVFITMAAHVAAMAPGTSIGAASPVMGDGKDIEGDMRAKAQNMASAMVKSIAEQRGRNAQWAEKAVTEASSLTETEALKEEVIDVIADDIDHLLVQLDGTVVDVQGRGEVALEDYSALPRTVYEISVKDRAVNFLANPNVAALLWLAATTGISIELYNPGAIVPGVVGVICLVLALAVSQIIPINYAGIALMVLGGLLIGAELYVTSGILGIAGVIALALGALYLVDTSAAPGLMVDVGMVLPVALAFGAFMLLVVFVAARVLRKRSVSGYDGLVGVKGKAVESFEGGEGRVFIHGETWKAVSQEVIEKGDEIEVVGKEEGLCVRVKRQ